MSMVITQLKPMESLATSDSFVGALKPHFAYGTLGKQQYAVAHAKHVFNHLTECSLATSTYPFTPVARMYL